MGHRWPRFRVFVVKDGKEYGLLIWRKKSQHEPEEAGYFWLQADDGLTLTPEIAQVCQNRRQMLSDNRYNRRFVQLILNYVTTLSETGRVKVSVEELGSYHSGDQCSEVIDRFFARGDKELKQFLRCADIFKHRVLVPHFRNSSTM